jgi:hypothetical protein
MLEKPLERLGIAGNSILATINTAQISLHPQNQKLGRCRGYVCSTTVACRTEIQPLSLRALTGVSGVAIRSQLCTRNGPVEQTPLRERS